MSEEKLKEPGKTMGRPSGATLEQKAAIFGVLNLYPRRSREFRRKRREFADEFGVDIRTIDNWFDAMSRQFERVSA